MNSIINFNTLMNFYFVISKQKKKEKELWEKFHKIGLTNYFLNKKKRATRSEELKKSKKKKNINDF